MNSNKNEGMVKIRFSQPGGDSTETLWAKQIDTNIYQIDNSPFLTYGVSWRDVVEARPGDDQVLDYVRCVRKSGNRTLRVIFQNFPSNDNQAERVLMELRALGCSYEGMQPRLISINVPPGIDLGLVTDFLKRESGLQWEYADPTYEQVVNRLN